MRINSVPDVKCFCNNKNMLRAQSMVWHFVRHSVDNGEKYGRAREATDNNITRRKDFASWISKTTDTHSEYVSLIVFPRQLWSHEPSSALGYVLTACLVFLAELKLCHTCLKKARLNQASLNNSLWDGSKRWNSFLRSPAGDGMHRKRKTWLRITIGNRYSTFNNKLYKMTRDSLWGRLYHYHGDQDQWDEGVREERGYYLARCTQCAEYSSPLSDPYYRSVSIMCFNTLGNSG